MKAYYSDHFVLPLPPNHRFPMGKYALLREKVAHARIAELRVPDAATDSQILLAHDYDYLEKVKSGILSAAEMRRIGFPWSEQMVERSRRSVGGTISACRDALAYGVAANLAGGTHHAGADHGEGYCVFNDVAIAARTMQHEGRVRRVLIVDCDVHQGNGTAAIFQRDSSVFTFSIHGEHNFPFRKIMGDLDIGLPDNTGDEAYLDMLEIALERAFYAAQPNLVIYLSGADPFVEDTLGKLALSKNGLAQRDRLVFETCYAARIPVAVTMGGGYAKQIEDIASIHFQTISIAAEVAQKWSG